MNLQSLERRVLFALYGPDVSFGEGGHTDIPAASAVDPKPDGKIITVGARRIPPDPEFIDAQPTFITTVSRANSDGTLDTTFGQGGMFEFGETGDVAYNGSTLFVIDDTNDATFDTELRAFRVADEQPDTSFSADGIAAVPFAAAQSGDPNGVGAVLINETPDNKLLLRVNVSYGGVSFVEYIEWVRLNLDGSVDTTFGNNGFLVFDPGLADVDLIPTTRSLFVAERAEFGISPVEITRFSPDGKTQDMSFAGDGVLEVNTSWALRELDDGKILLSDNELSRLNADGSLDTTFGTNGKVALFAPGGLPNTSERIEIDPQGRIMLFTLGRVFRFSAGGVLEAAPFNGMTDFLLSGVTAFDSAGRVLMNVGEGLTRFDVRDEVEVGRDHVVYIEGAAGDDDLTVQAGATGKLDVVLNAATTSVDSADLAGVSITLRDGDHDVLVSVQLPVTLTAGEGDATITTSNADDEISLGEGSHTLNIGDGNDTVFIRYNDDFQNTTDLQNVTGRDGNKNIEISNGKATINLGVGDSQVVVGSGAGDAVVNIAGGNNDVQVAGFDDTVTIGGNGNNKVLAILNNSATITTGGGDDDIDLSENNATCHAGARADHIRIQTTGGSILVFAGEGNDVVEPIDLTLYGPTATIFGEAGNDILRGGFGGQSLYGNAGTDTLYGMAGSDLLSGGGGNDYLIGQSGNDRLYGGEGRDHLYGARATTACRGVASGDWLYSQGGNDQLTGDGGNDRLYADYSTGNATLHGNAGDDLLVARNSLADALFGDRGRDTAIADQDDVLTGIETTA